MRDPSFIDDVFEYHPPADDTVCAKYKAIRAKAKELAQVIFDNCPPCADRTDAVRKVREAVMTANASIALDGKI